MKNLAIFLSCDKILTRVEPTGNIKSPLRKVFRQKKWTAYLRDYTLAPYFQLQALVKVHVWYSGASSVDRALHRPGAEEAAREVSITRTNDILRV